MPLMIMKLNLKLNKIKYLNYITRVIEKYYKENENFDLMKLVILSLTVPGPEGKQEMLEKVVELAEQIKMRINMTQLRQLHKKRLSMITES